MPPGTVHNLSHGLRRRSTGDLLESTNSQGAQTDAASSSIPPVGARIEDTTLTAAIPTETTVDVVASSVSTSSKLPLSTTSLLGAIRTGEQFVSIQTPSTFTIPASDDLPNLETTTAPSLTSETTLVTGNNPLSTSSVGEVNTISPTLTLFTFIASGPGGVIPPTGGVTLTNNCKEFNVSFCTQTPSSGGVTLSTLPSTSIPLNIGTDFTISSITSTSEDVHVTNSIPLPPLSPTTITLATPCLETSVPISMTSALPVNQDPDRSPDVPTNPPSHLDSPNSSVPPSFEISTLNLVPFVSDTLMFLSPLVTSLAPTNVDSYSRSSINVLAAATSSDAIIVGALGSDIVSMQLQSQDITAPSFPTQSTALTVTGSNPPPNSPTTQARSSVGGGASSSSSINPVSSSSNFATNSTPRKATIVAAVIGAVLAICFVISMLFIIRRLRRYSRMSPSFTQLPERSSVSSFASHRGLLQVPLPNEMEQGKAVHPSYSATETGAALDRQYTRSTRRHRRNTSLGTTVTVSSVGSGFLDAIHAIPSHT